MRTPHPMKWSFSPARRAPFLVSWAAVLMLLTVALTPFREHLDPGTAALLLLAAPLLAAGAGLRAAAIASVVSALTLNFFFTRPYNSLVISAPAHVAAIVLYLAIALAFGAVINLVRRESERSSARAREADLLRELTIDLLRQSVWLQTPFDEATHKLQTSLKLAYAHLEIAIEGGEQFATREGIPSMRADDLVVLPIAAGDIRFGSLSLAPATESVQRVGALYANVLALACERARYMQDAVQRRVLEASDRHRIALMQSVSHDLRTPLTAMRALASALPEIGALSDGQLSVLADLDNEAERLGRMVTQVLDLTRIESGALRPHIAVTRLDEIVYSAAETVRRSIPGVTIKVAIEEQVPAAPVDEPLISQVLINLLENAVHHGGSQIELLVRERHQRVEVLVRDHGPGVDEADRKRIFDSGFAMVRATSASRARGLGLAVSQGFVEAHHGHIRVEPTPGGGATFVVSLPADIPAREAEPT
ncbi:MAG: DUF4118 domain-containing protein [Thermoleophilia bacterium]|nr:DUF4118 domain-containing protein [Thermoleophilia bacterium]